MFLYRIKERKKDLRGRGTLKRENEKEGGKG